MKESKIYFSSNLRHLRIATNKTLNEIAQVVEKSIPTVSLWESGLREPSAVDLAKLCNYFNIDIDAMLLKDLRFDEELKLDKDHILRNVIYDKTKDLSEKDKEKIIELIDLYTK